MRALVLHRYGKTPGPKLEEMPDPVPGPDDLLVRVHAASVNPVDFKIRDGGIKVLVRYRFPLVMGNDLSGEVVAVGTAVRGFKVGDAVYSRLDKDRIGAFAELALVRERAAALKPVNLSHEEAASLPLVALTAWQVLERAQIQTRPGQKVLVHAGSGGFGTIAIQLAKHFGCHVVTTAGARNLELVRGLGADEAIDYRTTRFEDVVKDADLVIDTQGGEVLERSFQAVRPGGVVVSVAGLPDAKFAREYGLGPVLQLGMRFVARQYNRLARQRGARYEFLFMRADGEQLREITRLVEAGVIKPVVDRVVPFSDALEALAYSESGRATGKIVLRMVPLASGAGSPGEPAPK